MTTNPHTAVFAVPFLLILLGSVAATAEEQDAGGFVPIFDGRTLEGWRAFPEGAGAWMVQDGVIRGEGKEDRLAYLVYSGDEKLADFELAFHYRMVTDGNTGVEIRARVDKSGKRPLEGYHADLGHVGIGPLILGAWDFHFAKRREFPCERGTKLVINEDGTGTHSRIENAIRLEDIRKRDWNQCRIVARGNAFEFFINGKLASAFVDNFRGDTFPSGLIALQLHDKGMIVEFKDIRLKKS